MGSRIDLTPFGFTPTEGLVYEVLLTRGPGTGYAIARAAGLARANAYSALEGLVSKGAARVDGERPKRYRPEPPVALLSRIAAGQSTALEALRAQLEGLQTPATPTLVEIDTARGALQLIGHDVARATTSVLLLAPAEAYPLLAPSLRRPAGQGVRLLLFSIGEVTLDVAPVVAVPEPTGWPGAPILCVTDDRSAVVAVRSNGEVTGHWGSAPSFLAAARATVRALTGAA